ncbi:SpoIID/LytB domain-containing protein [Priestia megaterium]|uniref:SpoIID/LytB domain-containing protein n=1 Tax=Priestia megaterium TaxID=1404 RepID=UPI001A94AA33|nr:SpoIID/LytB domain-containing protein [Priestia megaterium]QSX23915.1 SpoIID/LytB domain-containing protein [Priestia megaterium]
MKRLIVALIVSTLLLTICPLTFGQAETTEPIIKVKLLNYLGNQREITIQTSINTITSDSKVTLQGNQMYHLKVEQGKISLYENTTKINTYDSFSLYATSENQTLINNRLYSGNFEFNVENNQFIRPINHVLMEQYLKGVVPNEMIASWNLEALKAQAVSARTYAMAYLGTIIDDTVRYQVYGGYGINQNTNKAVDDTACQTLTYQGKLINAPYSSSNGGRTESNANVWIGETLPYLPIKNDPYDPKNPWSLNIKKKQIDLTNKDLKNVNTWWGTTQEVDQTLSTNLKNYLYNNGYKGKDIKIIEIPMITFTNKLESNRYSLGSLKVNFLVKGDVNSKGELNIKTLEKTNIKASDLRTIIGTGLLRSLYITKQETANDIISITGLGFGHGVGMSQYGAKSMGEQGKTYKDILNFYYPSTTLTNQYTQQPLLKTDRIAGADRYDTAVSISQKGWKTSNTVILVRSDKFPDALAGAPLAAQENAPILLTPSHRLNDQTKREIIRLQAKKVIILGATPAISDNVKNELTGRGIDVERIGGANRSETAAEIAKKLNSSNQAIIAYDNNFPDALSIAPYAVKHGIPILLTGTDKLPTATVKALQGKEKTIVVGSSKVVSDQVFGKLPNPTRYSGAVRYDTNREIVTKLPLGKDKAYIATGENFPDALAGSVLAAQENAPIILVRDQQVPEPTKTLLEEYKTFSILGSSQIIGDDIEQRLNQIILKQSINLN